MNTTATTKRLNPWPYAIIGYFVIFIAFIISFSTFAIRQQIDLVSPGYYEDEIRFQQQIETTKRTLALGGDVSIAHDAALGVIRIKLPADQLAKSPAGQVRLYRPSDAHLDRQFKFVATKAGVEPVKAEGLAPGLWKLRVRWQVDGQDYALESPIVIAAKK
jgi:nitrogen fixation protein FixH